MVFYNLQILAHDNNELIFKIKLNLPQKRLVGSANALLTSSPVMDGERQLKTTSSRRLSMRGNLRTKSMFQVSIKNAKEKQVFNPFNPSNMDTPKNSNRRRLHVLLINIYCLQKNILKILYFK